MSIFRWICFYFYPQKKFLVDLPSNQFWQHCSKERWIKFHCSWLLLVLNQRFQSCAFSFHVLQWTAVTWHFKSLCYIQFQTTPPSTNHETKERAPCTLFPGPAFVESSFVHPPAPGFVAPEHDFGKFWNSLVGCASQRKTSSWPKSISYMHNVMHIYLSIYLSIHRSIYLSIYIYISYHISCAYVYIYIM